jgi:hypothetical protein
MSEFRISEFYKTTQRNWLLQQPNGRVKAADYIRNVLATLVSRVQPMEGDFSVDPDKNVDTIFGSIFSAALDHECLADYFISHHEKDIQDGGLADNVIRLLQELTQYRTIVADLRQAADDGRMVDPAVFFPKG